MIELKARTNFESQGALSFDGLNSHRQVRSISHSILPPVRNTNLDAVYVYTAARGQGSYYLSRSRNLTLSCYVSARKALAHDVTDVRLNTLATTFDAIIQCA